LVIGTLIGLIIGWLRGGSLAKLAYVRFRLWWFIPTALVIQVLLQLYGSSFLSRDYILFFYLVSLFLILIALIANYRLPFIGLLIAGVFLNFLVILVNGGMPVFDPTGKYFLKQGKASSSSIYIEAAAQTRLAIFGDWLAIPPPYPQPAIQSPGDIILAIGLLLFIQHAMVAEKEFE
jgi:hypothetical protein